MTSPNQLVNFSNTLTQGVILISTDIATLDAFTIPYVRWKMETFVVTLSKTEAFTIYPAPVAHTSILISVCSDLAY